MESNDSPQIPDKGETSDILGLPLGVPLKNLRIWMALTERHDVVLQHVFVQGRAHVAREKWEDVCGGCS